MLLNKKNITLNAKIEDLTAKLEGVTTELCSSKAQLSTVSVELAHLQQKVQKTIEDQIESMVGIDKWFNTDNQHKNQEIVKTGGANFRKTWLLMDSNNIVYIDDYPLLFEVLQAEDRGDGTFAMPDFHDGTLRHIRVGDTRELGTFEMDAMQSHVHSNTHSHTENAHNHPINDIKGGVGSWQASFINHNTGAFKDEEGASLKFGGSGNSEWSSWASFSSHRAGVTATNNTTATINNTTITTDSGTGKQAQETRMKNTSGQWYILAKVSYTA